MWNESPFPISPLFQLVLPPDLKVDANPLTLQMQREFLLIE